MNMQPSPNAVALLTREVLAEQIFRNRGALVDHINKTLKTREVDLDKLVELTSDDVLEMDKETLRAHAAKVLDIILSAK